MHMHGIIEKALASLRDGFPPGWGGFQILEIGTIRADGEAHRQGDGWSTVAFARDCEAQHGQGHLTSVDLHTEVAQRVIEREGLSDYVTFREGYSIEWMASMLAAGQRFEVILLDSENDGQLTLHEFMLAEKLLARPGLILVDDVVPGSFTVVKGQQLVPYLDQRGTDYLITERRGGGVVSGVMAVPYQ